jgi:polar amino acid transport system permease protein
VTTAAATGTRQLERALAKRRQTQRRFAIAAISSLLVIAAAVVVVVTAPGWDDVQQTFFSWDAFKDSFPDLLEAFWLDVRIFVLVEIGVLIWSLGVALIRTSTSPALFPLRVLAVAYVDVFRGIPTLLLVYLIGFGIPALQIDGLPTDPVLLGGIALGLSYGAYVAEVYRAGIQSVHSSQRDAALAIGLTEVQSLRFVVLPQAVRNVGPPLLNDFIALQKDAVLISILGPQELFRVAQIDAASTFNYTPLVAGALIYMCVTIPLARIVDRYGIGGRAR